MCFCSFMVVPMKRIPADESEDATPEQIEEQLQAICTLIVGRSNRSASV